MYAAPVPATIQGIVKDARRVSIVIPAWNEAATIGGVIREVLLVLDPVMSGAFAVVVVVVVVDNGSTDDTAARAREAGAVVVSENRRGYGQACLTGIAASAGSDFVMFMDGDGSDDPAGIPSLLRPLQDDLADLVIGSRERGVSEPGAHPWHAVYGTRLCVTLMNVLIGTKATDLGPFRAISYAALQRLDMKDTTFGWTTEMQIKAHRARLRTAEVPVNYRCRRGGHSKISGSWPQSARAGIRILSLIAKMASAPSLP